MSRDRSHVRLSWDIFYPIGICMLKWGYPNKTWDIPVLMTFPNISWDIPKLNKNRWDIMGQLEIKQKQMGLTQHVTYPGISQDKHVCTDLYQGFIFVDIFWYPKITSDIMVYPGFRDARQDIPNPPPQDLLTLHGWKQNFLTRNWPMTQIKCFIWVDPILISHILAKWNCLFGRGDFEVWAAPALLKWYIGVILGTE